MRLYVAVARATYRQMTTYRGATFAGIVTNTVFGFILAYVMLAVFRQRPVIGGFDAVDAVTFTFVTQGLLMVVGIFGRTDQGIRIRTGDVAIDLSRPHDYQAWWAAVAYGRSISTPCHRPGPDPRHLHRGTRHRRHRPPHLLNCSTRQDEHAIGRCAARHHPRNLGWKPLHTRRTLEEVDSR